MGFDNGIVNTSDFVIKPESYKETKRQREEKSNSESLAKKARTAEVVTIDDDEVVDLVEIISDDEVIEPSDIQMVEIGPSSSAPIQNYAEICVEHKENTKKI